MTCFWADVQDRAEKLKWIGDRLSEKHMLNIASASGPAVTDDIEEQKMPEEKLNEMLEGPGPLLLASQHPF